MMNHWSCQEDDQDNAKFSGGLISKLFWLLIVMFVMVFLFSKHYSHIKIYVMHQKKTLIVSFVQNNSYLFKENYIA